MNNPFDDILPDTVSTSVISKRSGKNPFDDIIPESAPKNESNPFDDIIPDSTKTGEIPFDKLSGLGKTLDIVNRPSQTVKSVIKEDIANPPKNPLAAISPLAHLLRPNILEAAKRGFTGQEHTTMNEIYKKVGIEGIPGLGFASEVAVDPLTYTAGPIVKGIAKVAGPAVKGLKWLGGAAREIPAIDNVVTKVGEAAAPVMQGLKKAFSTSTGIPQLDELITKYSSEKEYLRGKSMEYGVKVRKAIENMAQKTGRSVDDISKEIVNLVELPRDIKTYSIKAGETIPETQVLANVLKNHFGETLTKEMKAGVPITSLSENRRGIQYFPRITTQEAKEYLSNAKIGNSRVWNPTIKNALKRRTEDFTLDEFNTFAKEHGLESLGGRSVEQYFMQNPAYAVAIRDAGSAKAVTSAKFIQDAGKIFGKKASDALPFWKEVPDTLQNLYPPLKGKRFDPEVLDEIMRTHEKVFNPKEVGGFLKLFDKVQNTWKAWMLSPIPSYHIRNSVGNIWNNYLGGVVNPESYLKATQLQDYAKTGSIKSLSTFGKNFFTKSQADELVSQANKLGVTGKGWYGADIPKMIEEEVGKGSKNILSVRGPLIRSGRTIGKTIEDNARLAHFVDKLGKGLTPEGAALSTKKYLFDYGDLTNFEKEVMKRFAPFYTWTRKNLPLQAEMLLTQPQKFIPIAKMLQGRNQADLNKLEYAQPSLSERLPVELNRTKNSVTYLPLEGLLPAADLSKIARPQELLTEMLNPYIKTGAEILINKSFFTEKEIQKYPKETQELLKMDMPAKWKYALTSVVPQARLVKLIYDLATKKDMTLGEKAFQTTLSKVYHYNLDDLRLKGLQGIKRKVDDLKQAFSWATRRGREKEKGRILDTIHETMDELGDLY